MILQIKKFRQKLNLTQQELAELLNNKQRNISNWESGISMPDAETLIKLSEIFNVSIEELLGYENSEKKMLREIAQKFAGAYASLSDEQKNLLADLFKTNQ